MGVRLSYNVVAEVLEELTHPLWRKVRHGLPFRYEPRVVGLLTETFGDTFVDVGANTGYYCTLLADNFRRIVAIEPAQDNVRLMRLIFRLTGVRANILPFAVSDRDGISSIISASDAAGHQLDMNLPNQKGRPTTSVQTVSLDSLVAALGKIDLVKVDVESAEWLVLSGAEKSTKLIRSWVIELHLHEERERLQAWMRAHSYDYHWLDDTHIYAWH